MSYSSRIPNIATVPVARAQDVDRSANHIVRHGGGSDTLEAFGKPMHDAPVASTTLASQQHEVSWVREHREAPANCKIGLDTSPSSAVEYPSRLLGFTSPTISQE